MNIPSNGEALHHHLQRMAGRDPHERHRVATPLELLFDLTFAIAFGVAASNLALLLTEGQYFLGLLGFGFASFAISWAWVNFSWFSSAYDTDDWAFRLTTMAQMTGVIVLAIGLPRMFASLEGGKSGHIDNSIMVFGYVIMRIAMLLQWLRAAQQNPARRRTCLTYAITISVAQVGWIAQALLDLSMMPTFILTSVLILVELTGPFFAERRDGGTPWHAHHIAERYASLAIIALGEGIVGTMADLSALIDVHTRTFDAVLVCIAGVGLTFGIWWGYYLLPSAQILHAHRGKAFVWGYLQMMIITSIVAIGAGLRVAAYYLENKTHISALATLLATAIPVGIVLILFYALYYYLIRRNDRLHTWLLTLTALVMAVTILAAAGGLSMPICLCLLMLAPIVTVVGYEWKGHRHQAESVSSTD
jgi:low temperature requirement protein LtrA